ncbi:unnamed protein product [Orchesella dallaii]|uniref:Major facilitator superfamily (MFS) profile domain-containing protein n=1 Tax=Orchesella dallaii TaxID=48710 RepID=A0ABP1QN09_9HEXA
MKYRINTNQTFAAFFASVGAFGCGLGLAWTATAFPDLDASNQVGIITSVEKSWIASLLTIGAILGCPITGLLINNVGRKKCLVILSFIGLLGWLLLAVGTHVDYLYVGRLLTGISTGGYSIVIPVYVGEIASKENRGLLGSLFLIMLCLGKLFSNIIGVFYSARTTSLVCSLHPLLYGILLTALIPESPTFLMKKDKVKAALRSQAWLEMDMGSIFYFWNLEIQESTKLSVTLAHIKSSIPKMEDNTLKVSWKECLTSWRLLKPCLSVFMLMVLAQFTGINVTTFYTVDLFQQSGELLINSKLATVILAAIQTVGCIPASLFIDRYGRKVLLTSSFTAMTVALAGFSVFFYLKDVDQSSMERYPWVGAMPLVFLVVYSLAYSWGIGNVIWVMMPEILPPQIKGSASALANIINWGGAFIVIEAFQLFASKIPIYIWFSGFTLVSVFGCIFTFFCVPETKGLSLEEIQAFYENCKDNKSNALTLKSKINENHEEFLNSVQEEQIKKL